MNLSQDSWFAETEKLFQEVPEDWEEGDNPATIAKQNAIDSIRRVIAEKWTQVLKAEPSKARQDACKELEAFLAEMHESYQSLVLFSPWPPGAQSMESQSTSCGDVSSSQMSGSAPTPSSIPEREMAVFEWKYIDSDGHCLGIMKAGSRFV